MDGDKIVVALILLSLVVYAVQACTDDEPITKPEPPSYIFYL